MKKEITALILTGGESSRFGSNKTSALLGRKTLINHVIDSIPKRWPIVMVGPNYASPRNFIQCTREVPAGGGPVCAIEAGLRLISTEFVAVIASDMPFAGRVIKALSQQVIAKDALIAIDEKGYAQTLCAIYRTEPLHTAIKSLEPLAGLSMKKLLPLLDAEKISLGKEFASSLLDIDTPEDLQRLKSEE